MLVLAGCSYRNTPVDLRERLAFDPARLGAALDEMDARYGCEAVLLSTCNRVEVYAGRADGEHGPGADLMAEFLAQFHNVPVDEIRPHLYCLSGPEVVRHLFRVAASLDSMIIGEGQIAAQVHEAYDTACARETAGPLMHALFNTPLSLPSASARRRPSRPAGYRFPASPSIMSRKSSSASTTRRFWSSVRARWAS